MIQEVLDIIDKEIAVYYEHSDKMKPHKLLRMQDVLSVNSYYLAEQLHYSNKEAVENKLVYHFKTIRWFLTIKSEKIDNKAVTDKVAQCMAEDDSQKEWEAEIDKRVLTFWLDKRLKQVNSILHSISQRIAYLKQELNNK